VTTFIQALVAGLSEGSIFALLALGLALIYRATTILNFSHGINFTLGAFLALVISQQLDLPLWITVLVAVAVVFVFGLLTQRLVIQPLMQADHLSQVFATIAVLFIGQGVVRYFLTVPTRLPPVLGADALRIGDVALNRQYIASIVTMLVVTAVVAYLFTKTGIGRVLRGTTQSLRGAALVGIDTRRVFLVTWAAAAALAAVAGVLAGPVYLVSADMGTRSLILAFAGMTLGGFGSIPGAVVGSLIVGLTGVMAATYVSTTLGDAAGFALILIVLMVRPQGIFGTPGEDLR
jgi:branched-chain amino acid transport system permease protein